MQNYMQGLSTRGAKLNLVDGIVSDDLQYVSTADGQKYRIKESFQLKLMPGEKVQFVAHLRSYLGETYAGEIWLQNERRRRAHRRSLEAAQPNPL